MKRSSYAWALLLLVLLIGTPPIVQAQFSLSETYLAPDGSFTFNYPFNWSVKASGLDAPVRVTGSTVSLLVYSPASLAALGLGNAADLDTLIDGFVQNLDPLPSRIQASEAIDLDGRAGQRVDYVDPEERTAFLLGVTFHDDRLGLIQVTTEGAVMSSMDRSTALNLAATFDATGASLPYTLTAFADGWQEATAELESEGVIPFGGSLVFLEDRAFFSGQGSFYTPLADRSPFQNIVMGGWLEFTPGSDTEYEECTLGSRIAAANAEGYFPAYLDIGLDNLGGVFYFDRTEEEGAQSYDDIPLTGSLDDPHHFLIVLIDNQLSFYVDGVLAFDHAPVEARPGFYGVGLIGEGPNTLCVGRDVWAYALPSSSGVLCEAASTQAVNRRAGPGTNFASMGQLIPGNNMEVIGQAPDPGGIRWWQLEDESWVREDVVTVLGACGAVPAVTP